MRVVFMGTPDFAVPSLDAVAEDHSVAAVYTRPDAISRRGRATSPPPVKVRALELGIPVRQPVTLRDDAEIAHLTELAPDVIIVAAYGLILPPQVLAVPARGALNVHASLLPAWRGAAPVQRAILAGDSVTGISIMRMEEGLDTGPYALQVPVRVADHDAATLTLELARVGADALSDVLRELESGDIRWVPQDDATATYAAKLSKDDVRPSPQEPAEVNVRRIRASGPSAPARASVDGRSMTLLSARSVSFVLRPGELACADGGLVFGASDGSFLVTTVKPDGRHEMSAASCARGLNLTPTSTWTGA